MDNMNGFLLLLLAFAVVFALDSTNDLSFFETLSIGLIVLISGVLLIHILDELTESHELDRKILKYGKILKNIIYAVFLSPIFGPKN